MSKQKSSESKSGSAQTWAQPLATNAANQVSGVFNANQPALQSLTNQQNSSLIQPLQQRFNSTLPTANQSNQYYSDVLGGKYLNGNPYLGQVQANVNRGIADNVNSQFEGAGRYGSDAYAGELARQTGIADTNLQYGNYSDEMNRMGQAAGAASDVNNVAAQGLSSVIGQNAALPYTGTQAMSGSLGQLFNGGTSVQYSPNPIWGAIGAGLGAAGQIFAPHPSDRRLKTNIRRVGQLEDGLNVFEFAYKDEPAQRFRGVMADEVKELRPQAYIENFNGSGYAGVDYSKLAA